MKTKIIKFGIYFLSIPCFIIFSFIGSMAIYGFMVPDPCEYHTIDDKDISFLFKLFYPMTSGNGYHPEPGFFNFVFFAVIGVLLGTIVSRMLIKLIYRKKIIDEIQVLDKFE